MVVLSLFDGVSCGMIALERAGIKVERYFAKCSKHNYGDKITHIGDVTEARHDEGMFYTENGIFEVEKIDLLIIGSPCQDFSSAKMNGLGLGGDKSKLFYEYLRAKNEVAPTYFLLENVNMDSESKAKLDTCLEVNGIRTNSSLVSFQKRDRVCWTNIDNVGVPSDKNISFQNYKGIGDLNEAGVNKTSSRTRMWSDGNETNKLGTCVNTANSDDIGVHILKNIGGK